MARFPLILLVACTGLEPEADKSTVPDQPDTDTDTDADSDADGDTDTDADTDTDTDTDPVPGIVVDGSTSEWPAGSWFPTTGGRTGVSWDADDLFLAVEHPDLGAGAEWWVVVTLGDGGSGTAVGIQHGTQSPAIPFPATDTLRFKADASFQSLLEWDGSQWVETAGFLGTDGSAFVVNRDLAELSVPFARLGIGGAFDLHVNLVFEGAGNESSYAPTPAESFADGYDPDYGAWFHFDPSSPTAPADYPVEPAPGPGHTGLDHTGLDHTGLDHTGLDTGATAHTGGAAPFGFTATIDGDLGDWPAGTSFTTSAGTTTRLAWDATDVFVALTHPDVATGGPLHWLVITSGSGTAGSTTGSPLGTQEPALAFDADKILRIKLDGSYDDLQELVAGAWSSGPAFAANGAKAESGDSLELRFPRAALGLADRWDVAAWVVYEGAPYESSYAVTPDLSFADGSYDPDLAHFWSFDLASPLPPDQSVPAP